MSESPILQVDGIKKYFDNRSNLIEKIFGDDEFVHAVDDVSFDLHRNEVQGLIGESGCGKTTLLRLLIGLYDLTEGEILYKGDPVTEFGKADWKRFRRDVQLVFQDPYNSLDPKMKVREILEEPMEIHNLPNREERIRNTLEDVELSPPENYLDQYPKELSGGEKQRVSIGRALTVDPDILLADEPVSMLDVSTQAAVLNLLSDLTEEYDLSMVYISHDLSTVSYVCDVINVMYLGRIVEQAPTLELINDPKHPYTKALIDACPIPDPHYNTTSIDIEGTAPNPIDLDDGCRFRDRCLEEMDVCANKPRSVNVGGSHSVACHLYYEHGNTSGGGK